MGKRKKYQSRRWTEDYKYGRVPEPPAVWVLGTTYGYQSCGWAVLHMDGKPNHTLVVTTSDLGDEFVKVEK